MSKLTEEQAFRLGEAAQALLDNEAFKLLISELQKQAMDLVRKSKSVTDYIHAKAMLMTADSAIEFIRVLLEKKKVVEISREKKYKIIGGDL